MTADVVKAQTLSARGPAPSASAAERSAEIAAWKHLLYDEPLGRRPVVHAFDDAAPHLANGVELVGPMVDAGFAAQQWLIKRDGQYLQVSELLYRVAERADGTNTLDDIADGVTDAMPFAVTTEHIRRVIDGKLAPLGVVASEGGQPPLPTPRETTGPLQVNGRIATFPPKVVHAATGAFMWLFRPWAAIPLLAAIVALHVWLYVSAGLGAALVDLIQRPILVLPLFAVIVVAGFLHELGHATALRYGGGRCGDVGVGFYLIYPALYTDTSDAYRLSRRARIRVDLGGFYFHQVFALALIALALATNTPLLLLAVLMIDLETVRQLLFPFVRFDGYWLLADVTGIPDPYTHLAAVARSKLNRGATTEVPVLRRWPRRVFRIYAAVAVPVLVGLIAVFVVRAPSFVAVAWESLQRHADAVASSILRGDALAAAVAVLQVVLLLLPLIGGVYVVYSVGTSVKRLRDAMGRVGLRPSSVTSG